MWGVLYLYCTSAYMQNINGEEEFGKCFNPENQIHGLKGQFTQK